MKIALFPGSFDPFTNGHLNVLASSLKVVDRVVIGIATHHEKKSLFSFEDRKNMIEDAVINALPLEKNRVEVGSFDGLIVEAAGKIGATIIIRGVRDSTDFNYEMQMSGMNSVLDPTLQTVFLPSSAHTRPITATLVRQIAQMGGDVSKFVPENVREKINRTLMRSSHV